MRHSRYSIPTSQIFCVTTLLAMGVCFNATWAAAPQESDPFLSQSLKRVSHDIEFMASDEMGGRKPGTPGIKMCEDFLVDEYKKIGLKPLEDGTFLQEFVVKEIRQIGKSKKQTSLVLSGPDGKEMDLELGKQYQQLMPLKDFDLSSDLIFVGYGITAVEDHNYDDFGGIDVEGKIVVIIRYEPQSEDENSVFNGAETSRHAFITNKIADAVRAKAAGVIMVNDAANAPDEARDELVQATRFGSTRIPFAQLKRSVLNDILKVSPLTSPLGKSLSTVAAIEDLIDKNLEPISQPIPGWSAKFKCEFTMEEIKSSNVIGIIEGEGPNADETIVIGGHYDHLGMGGGPSSRAKGRIEIHNGADDNATGTAAILELARRFQRRGKKPGRRLVFVCFTGEEMGLLGAIHYCENPIFPLERTAAMINFDMIGWLREDKLTLYNWDTSRDFDPIFEMANESFDFSLVKPTNRFGGSDHLPFNQRGVPNMFIHTGQNAVYHTPEDDFEAINCEGAVKVIEYSEIIIDKIAEMENKPRFGKPKPFRLGVRIVEDDGGVKVTGVVEDSIAEQAGFQANDVILAIDDEAIEKRVQLNKIIKRDRGKTLKFKLKRDDAEVLLNVEMTNGEED
ncbi:MAG: M20/M25/M40 family metallo-hydrolase [Mariniblastus sp.]